MRAVIEAKTRWGVSALALTYRLHEEALITDWEYQQLCIQLRGKYGSSEPNEGSRESSQVLTKVFGALKEAGIGRRQIADDLGIRISDLDELFHVLALTPVSGGGAGGDPSLSRAAVRLVN